MAGWSIQIGMACWNFRRGSGKNMIWTWLCVGISFITDKLNLEHFCGAPFVLSSCGHCCSDGAVPKWWLLLESSRRHQLAWSCSLSLLWTLSLTLTVIVNVNAIAIVIFTIIIITIANTRIFTVVICLCSSFGFVSDCLLLPEFTSKLFPFLCAVYIN